MLYAISINFVKFRFHGRVFGGKKQEALIVAFGPNDAGKKLVSHINFQFGMTVL